MVSASAVSSAGVSAKAVRSVMRASIWRLTASGVCTGGSYPYKGLDGISSEPALRLVVCSISTHLGTSNNGRKGDRAYSVTLAASRSASSSLIPRFASVAIC